MGLIKQLETVEQGRAILANASRAAQQFSNSATSLMAELAAFEASLPDSGLDQSTLAEIATRKSDTITAIQTLLATIQTALTNL